MGLRSDDGQPSFRSGTWETRRAQHRLVLYSTVARILRRKEWKARANAHEKGEIMAADITRMFLKPILMEYEKAYGETLCSHASDTLA